LFSVQAKINISQLMSWSK